MSNKPELLGYVYLFKNEFGYVKIGYSHNPDSRAKKIEFTSGVTIIENYLSPVCNNFVDIERELKQHFAPYRKRGEWFDIEFATAKTALDKYFPERNTPAIEPLIPLVNQAIAEDEEELTVNARDLHTFLESKQEFAHWIKNRIEKYGFTQNVDYSTFDNFINRGENSNLGTRTTEYLISLDMAKELSMVENTPKGKEARQYFIACEKALKAERKQTQPINWRNIRETALQIHDTFRLLGLKDRQLADATVKALYDDTGVDLGDYFPLEEETASPRIHIDKSIDAWFKACVILDSKAQTNVGNADKKSDGSYKNADKWLYPNYCDFCARENLEPVSLRRFSGLLISYCQQQELNVKRPYRSSEGTKIKGIRLRYFN